MENTYPGKRKWSEMVRNGQNSFLHIPENFCWVEPHGDFENAQNAPRMLNTET